MKTRRYRIAIDLDLDEVEPSGPIILTGPPSAGKTTFLRKMQNTRPVVEEAARDVIREWNQQNKWGKGYDFQGELYQEALKRVENAPPGAMLDRSHIDGLAYGYVPKEPPKPIKDAEVWWFRGHRERYKTDAERKETFEEAQELGEKLKATYQDLGYKVREIDILNPETWPLWVRKRLEPKPVTARMMASLRSRRAGIGPLPQKGQFSQLPSDVWVEVDGGHQIGNENEFPPDPARSQERAIIDEVNMLRNDVSQRAAKSRRAKIAKEMLGMEFDTEDEKKKYQQEHEVRPGTKLTVKKTKEQAPDKGYKDRLKKLYFDYTGAGEEEDYDKAKFRFVPFLKETRPGGKLEHLRPQNGTTLYRGKSSKDKGGGGVIESFSTNLHVAEFFKPKGGVIESLTVTPDVLALDFRKVYPGALAGEVVIFRGGRHKKSGSENDVSQRAASDKDESEFKGLLRRLESEGKRTDKGDKLTEMLAPEKFSFKTRMIVGDLISLMEDNPGLKELVPESLRGFFEGHTIAWSQPSKLWKHAMVSRRAKIAKELAASVPRFGIENLPEGVPQPPHAERNNISKIIVEKIETGHIRNEHGVIEEIKNFEKDYGLRDTPEGKDIWNWFKKHQAKLLAMGDKR